MTRAFLTRIILHEYPTRIGAWNYKVHDLFGKFSPNPQSPLQLNSRTTSSHRHGRIGSLEMSPSSPSYGRSPDDPSLRSRELPMDPLQVHYLSLVCHKKAAAQSTLVHRQPSCLDLSAVHLQDSMRRHHFCIVLGSELRGLSVSGGVRSLGQTHGPRVRLVENLYSTYQCHDTHDSE